MIDPVTIIAIAEALRRLIIVIGPFVMKHPWRWDAGVAVRGLIDIMSDPDLVAAIKAHKPGCRVLEWIELNGDSAIAAADAATRLHGDIKRTLYIADRVAKEFVERAERVRLQDLEEHDS